jgi:acyl carrier protein
MTERDRKLKEIVAGVLLIGESEVKDTISREDVEAWDSLAHLMLINDVEIAFDVTFSDDDILEINTISDLKEKLRSHDVEF